MQPKRDSSKLEARVAEYILVHTIFVYLHECMHVYGFKTRTNFDAATSMSPRFVHASISNTLHMYSNSFAFTNFRTRRLLHNLIARIRKQRQPRLQPLPRRPLIEHVSLPNLD